MGSAYLEFFNFEWELGSDTLPSIKISEETNSTNIHKIGEPNRENIMSESEKKTKSALIG